MQNTVVLFNQESKPYELCIAVNGYECYVYHDTVCTSEDLSTTKTYIDFVFPVQEINHLVAEFELEYSTEQAMLWFGACKQNVIIHCTSKELSQVSKGFDLNNETTKTHLSSPEQLLLLLSYLTGLVSDYWFNVTCLGNVKGEQI